MTTPAEAAAQSEVDKLQEEVDAQEAKLVVVSEEAAGLDAERQALEVKAYGENDKAALKALDGLEARVAKNKAAQRGISSKMLELLQQLAEAREDLRGIAYEADTTRMRALSVDIAQLQAKLDAKNSERAELLNYWANRPSILAAERREEAAAVAAATETVSALAVRTFAAATRGE